MVRIVVVLKPLPAPLPHLSPTMPRITVVAATAMLMMGLAPNLRGRWLRLSCVVSRPSVGCSPRCPAMPASPVVSPRRCLRAGTAEDCEACADAANQQTPVCLSPSCHGFSPSGCYQLCVCSTAAGRQHCWGGVGSPLTSHTCHALTIMRLVHVRDHMDDARRCLPCSVCRDSRHPLGSEIGVCTDPECCPQRPRRKLVAARRWTAPAAPTAQHA